jgi:predicted acylesterase/phospholipase RssA
VPDRLPDYLMAGAWLPILAGPPPVLDGRRYLDGGLLWPDPLYAALDEKCTHVLMLNTAPEGAPDNTSPFMAKALRRVLNRWRTGLGDAYIGGRGPWAADRKELGNAENVELRGTQVFRLCPSAGSHQVERLTVIRGELLDGARAGYTTIMNEFGQRETRAYFAVVLGN